MLDAFIIEEIKRRERAKRESERPVAQIPLPLPDQSLPQQREEKPRRGVVIIDVM